MQAGSLDEMMQKSLKSERLPSTQKAQSQVPHKTGNSVTHL